MKVEVSHYAMNANAPNVALRLTSAKNILGVIKKNFGTLPWCRRYLDRLGQDKYLLGVCTLIVSRSAVANFHPFFIAE